ncbi:MAG: pantetheine-phosphate adenylyltransferase [Spirochaetes bacterium]|nr:pantetheine-phosphate adenylyltransferase [Spirochaetota bacterium]NMB64162.1 pantetheine-phosphate adenylyltransferase [Spirochaetota bacterium]HOJ27710.1 pantetheine-phosphate adenylyltransferase [Spirochaetota bacterium]HOM10573.1 pantetheine-phosphate adenylyltransferase [Spirochaetota bacterium]HPP48733.1 pantetheine-phosphate adenylyltransferase [Spirochaetota bacterium]
MQIGIYPGSFDPLTCGHLDIIKRATQLFDKLIVAIARNSEKFPLFAVEERLAMLQECCRDISKVEITSFDGLLAEYCKKNNINFIVRGLRAIVDFEYEYAIALMNKELAPSVETIFLMSKSEFSFVSSKMVKEVASYGGDISRLVPQFVSSKLKEKFQSQ